MRGEDETDPGSEFTNTEVDVTVTVRIRRNARGEAAIARYVELDLEKAREMQTTAGLTRDQVELSLITQAIYSNREDASTMDGFADLERGDLTVDIQNVEEYP